MSLAIKEDTDRFVYVLYLEGNKFYVGKCSDVKKRWQQHRAGQGSVWTSLYKPVKIVTVYKQVSSFEEDKVTKVYMSRYGIDNVRGGSYITVQLSDEQIRAVKKELLFASDRCIRCEAFGHYAKNCTGVPSVSPSISPSSPSTSSEIHPQDPAAPSPSSPSSPSSTSSTSSTSSPSISPSISPSEKAAETLHAAYTKKGTLCKLCIFSINRHKKHCRYHCASSSPSFEQ